MLKLIKTDEIKVPEVEPIPLFNLSIEMKWHRGPYESANDLLSADKRIKVAKNYLGDHHINAEGKLENGHVSGLHTYKCVKDITRYLRSYGKIDDSQPELKHLEPKLEKYTAHLSVSGDGIFLGGSGTYPYRITDSPIDRKLCNFDPGEMDNLLWVIFFSGKPVYTLDGLYNSIKTDDVKEKIAALKEEISRYPYRMPKPGNKTDNEGVKSLKDSLKSVIIIPDLELELLENKYKEFISDQ